MRSFISESVAWSELRSLADIAIERIDTGDEYRPSLGLAELWIFPETETEEGDRWELVKTSGQRWEVDGDIEL